MDKNTIPFVIITISMGIMLAIMLTIEKDTELIKLQIEEVRLSIELNKLEIEKASK